MLKVIVDCATGDQTERELTPEELAQAEAVNAQGEREITRVQAEQDARRQAIETIQRLARERQVDPLTQALAALFPPPGPSSHV